MREIFCPEASSDHADVDGTEESNTTTVVCHIQEKVIDEAESSDSSAGETEDEESGSRNCEMKKNQPWEGQSKHALYSKVLFSKVEIRELKKKNINLEKEIKVLNRSLGTKVNGHQKLVDLRVTHNGVKDELRSANAKIALMKKEASARRAAAKDEETGAIATLKLQHQKTLNDEAFKFKKLEIDMGAERKIRVAVEAELTEAKKAVSKLRGQIDTLMMQQAKTDKSLSTMAEGVVVIRGGVGVVVIRGGVRGGVGGRVGAGAGARVGEEGDIHLQAKA